jgi:methanogenic corrinoid protein MtbC1
VGALTLAPAGAMLAPVTTAGEGIGALRDEFLSALIDRDAARARAVVEDGVAAGVPPGDIELDVVQPALYDVGHHWAIGDLNVAEEHYATGVAQGVVALLGARMRVPPSGGRLAVVTATPGELHALGPRIVADFLEADGWEVLHLGASTPAADLAQLVDHECPDLVALSTSTAGSVPGIAEVLGRLRPLRPRPFVVVGGQFWTAEASRSAHELGADAVARDPRMLVALARNRIPPREDS